MGEEEIPPEPPEDTSKEVSEGSGLSSMIGKLTSAEKFVAAGAGILVADYLLFQLILGKYSFFELTLLIAVQALFAIWVCHNRPSAKWFVPYEVVLMALGFSAGLLGLIELLGDIRGKFLDEAVRLIAGLITYLGAFLMYWGAGQMKDSNES